MGLLRQVLLGLGQGLIEQGKINEQRERDELLMRRELALKQLEFAHDDAASARDHQERLDEIAATGAENRSTALTEGVIKDRIAQRSDARDLNKAVTLKKIDFSNDAKLEGLRHRFKIEEGALEVARDLQKQLTLLGKKVDHWEVTRDRRLIAFDATGHPMTQTTTAGGFQPHTTGGDSLSDFMGDDGGIAPSSSRTQAEPAPQLAKPGKDAALAQLGNLYAKASQNPNKYRTLYPSLFDANGRIIPRDQAIAKVNQAYGG